MSRNYYNPSHFPALPTDTKINPFQPEDAEFYDPDAVHYVFVTEKGTYRDWTSAGEVYHRHPQLLAIGDEITFFHDQTDRKLGRCTLIGIKTPKGQRGLIPDKRMPHWVAK